MPCVLYFCTHAVDCLEKLIIAVDKIVDLMNHRKVDSVFSNQKLKQRDESLRMLHLFFLRQKLLRQCVSSVKMLSLQ